jgi:hypothetical protein
MHRKGKAREGTTAMPEGIDDLTREIVILSHQEKVSIAKEVVRSSEPHRNSS